MYLLVLFFCEKFDKGCIKRMDKMFTNWRILENEKYCVVVSNSKDNL